MLMQPGKTGILAVALILAGPAGADVVPAQSEHDIHAPEASEHGEGHEFHANVIGLFAGVTNDDRDGAFTLGLEYERRFSEVFGVGAVLERAWGDLDFWLYMVPFSYRAGPWKFYVAPGIEDSEHHGSEFLFRIGLERAFQVGQFEVSPQFNLDFVDGEEVIVLGLVFAKGY